MNSDARALAENSFSIGLFGGLAIGVPLMVLGFGALGTAVLMLGIFGGLLVETVQSDDAADDRADREAELSEAGDELDDLRRRYVEGDISEAEFEQRVERHLDGGRADSHTESTHRSHSETESATRR